MGFSFLSFSAWRNLRGAVPAASMLALMAATGAPCVLAAEPAAALLQGPGIAITAADIEADAQQRIPEEMRGLALSRAQTVQQMAGNLYVRRAMAEKAKALGLDADKAAQTALRLAQDKVLSDAYLSYLDKKQAVATPDVQAQARSEYRANPERFQTQEQVKVRHILLEGQSAEAHKKAEELLQSLRAGADFAELARKESIDKGSAVKGGELGFFGRGRMAPEFENAAFQLKEVGELSPVVQTQFGLHILQLQGQRAAGQLVPFDEIKEALEQEIRSKLTNQARVAEADSIRAQAVLQMDAIEAFASRHAEGGDSGSTPKKTR